MPGYDSVQQRFSVHAFGDRLGRRVQGQDI
jgi:hypothetical protein